MAKVTRKWRISVSLSQSSEGTYSSDTLGETSLTVGDADFSKIGGIVQAHAEAIRKTAELTTGPVPIETEAVTAIA